MPTSNWRVALSAAKRLALRFPGVTGVDYGYKYQGGERTSRLCVRFHVAQKKPLDALRPHELLPTDLGFIVCDVVHARYALHTPPPLRSDPARPSLSTSNATRQSAGTLGAIVRDAGSGRYCLLSNWHVLCGGTEARHGVSISRSGTPHVVMEPAQSVAALERWLDPKQGYDAAIAVLSAGVSDDDAIANIGIHIGGVEEPSLGLALVKSDAASGVTHAMVDGIEGMFELDYGVYGNQKHWMDGVRLIADPHLGDGAISVSSNSGAIWINPETQRAVALHFANNDGAGPSAGCAVAHPLSRIFDLLHLTL